MLHFAAYATGWLHAPDLWVTISFYFSTFCASFCVFYMSPKRLYRILKGFVLFRVKKILKKIDFKRKHFLEACISLILNLFIKQLFQNVSKYE